MSEIRLIANLEVAEGKESDARAALETLVATVRDKDDPAKTTQYDACLSEDGRTAMMMERYADGGALGEHMEHVGEALGAVLACTTPKALILVGEVPAPIQEALAQMSPTYLALAFSAR